MCLGSRSCEIKATVGIFKRKTLALLKKIEIAKKRQENMMIFWAKAIQSPTILAQLAQQSEELRLNQDGRKRKCLPSGTKQPEVPMGVTEPQELIETGKRSTNIEKEMQDLFSAWRRLDFLMSCALQAYLI